MRRIDFDPERDRASWSEEQRTAWDAWVKRANKAKAKLSSDADKLEDNIWSELKRWYLKYLFHGKCAYCESKIEGISYGEADHYRPKRRVSDYIDGKSKTVTDSKGREHPGYYWLAYEWSNLLPACQRCNNVKNDRFPIGKEYQFDSALDMRALRESESPLLLYPFGEDPLQYIRFGQGGVVAAIDENERGKATIEIFDLKRFTEERREQQENFLSRFAVQLLRGELKGDVPVESVMPDFLGPGARYSAAVLAVLAIEAKELEKLGARLSKAASRGPTPTS